MLAPLESGCSSHSHVSLVIAPYLLDTDIIFCIDERFRCGVGFCQGNNTCNILKVILIVYFHLWEGESMVFSSPGINSINLNPVNRASNLQHYIFTFGKCFLFDFFSSTVDLHLTFPIPEWACPIFTTTGKPGVVICRKQH